MRETLLEKKPVVIAIAIAAVIIGALLFYGILVTPERQPYRDAQAQFKNVTRALSSTNVSLNTGTASDEEFNKSVDVLKKAFASLTTEKKALAEQEVLKTGEGKTLYDAYNKKLDTYIAYNNDVLVSIQKLRPVLLECSNTMNTVSENAAGAKVLRSCAEKMGAVADIPDVDYQELAVSFQSDYNELADIFEQIDALQDPKGADSAKLAELTEARTKTTDKFSTTSDTFSSNVQIHRNQILTTNAEKALHDYLENKSRIF